jgi:3-hydroxy-5-methyl-1-naphthoate 3-O-methyltransferase
MSEERSSTPETRQITPLEATRCLWEMGLAYVYSQVLFTAIDLGLFDALSRGAATPDELARHLNIHPEGCRRLLVALRQLGLVDSDQHHYSNSALGAYLTADSPYPLHGLSMVGGAFYRMCEYLPDALREYSPRWQQALGTTAQETFAALYEDPVRLRRFTQLMDSNSILQGQEIATRLDFTPYRCLMDVAGGPGGLSIAIGRHYPHLRGIIMDVPPVCPIAEERIAAANLTERFTAVPADLIQGPYPTGADVITLGWILHDWNDESCKQILRHCFDALPASGTLLVIEKVLNADYSAPMLTTAIDVYMLAICEPGARERTELEYRTLLLETGFHEVQVIRLETTRDVIVAKKP